MDKAIQPIKNKILDRIIAVFFVLILPSYILSLLRWIDFGWQDISYYHTVIMLLLAGMIIKKQSLSLLFKSAILACIFFVAGIASLYHLGLTGVHFWVLLSVTTLIVFVSKKLGIIVAAIVAFAYLLIGWLHVAGEINNNINLHDFVHSPWHWLTVFTSVIAIIVFLVMSYTNLFRELKKRIKIADRASKKLKKHELELLKTQKRLSSSLKEMEKLNTTKDKLFSVVAHDLKGPFQSVMALSDEIVKNYDNYSTEEKKRFITAMNGSVNNTYKLLEDLLSWSKIQQKNDEIVPKRQNMLQLLKKVIESLQLRYEQKNVKLETNISDQLFFWGDEFMVAEIFRNLLTNALKFSYPETGKVKVSARVTHDEKKQSWIEVCVADNGAGIPSEKHLSLFCIAENNSTPGTASEKGTGLGLPICKDLVHKHKGKIWVDSQPGKGTSVYFTIPAENTIQN